MDYSYYILQGTSQQLLARPHQAVENVLATYEGMKLARDARELHGKPLQIIVDAQDTTLHYSVNQHAIFVNPDLVESHEYVTNSGEYVRSNLEQFLAHELTHSAQQADPSLLRAKSIGLEEIKNVYLKCPAPL